MAERLTLPPVFEVTLPTELTALQFLELTQLVETEGMWRDLARGEHYVGMTSQDPADEQVAERQRFAVSGVAIGFHPELGEVLLSVEPGQPHRTRLFVIIAYTPWTPL